MFAVFVYRGEQTPYERLMIYDHRDIKSFLSAEFTKHLKKNDRYSLRAFARKLGVAPSMVSEVLKGKKNISRDMAYRISEALELSQNETEYLSLLAEKSSVKSEKSRLRIYSKLKRMNQNFDFIDFDLENFKLISEWYHLPILELIGLEGEKLESQSMARKLGISSVELNDAIQRLIIVGLVEKTELGYVKRQNGTLRISSNVKNEALRDYHNTMLERAKSYLRDQIPSDRFVGSETLKFDEKDLEKANEIFEDCFRKIIELSEQSQNPKHIFHLGIQFYALTKSERGPRDV